MRTFDLDMKRHLPNFLTTLNLCSGCIALVLLFRGNAEGATWLVFAAALFDVLDGMVARWLGVQSPIGKELDSLADMVTFGVLPGVILFRLLQQTELEAWVGNTTLASAVQFFPFIVTAFSALRLAKFNIDTRQATGFIGLPTPANTLWIVSLPLIILKDPYGWGSWLLHPGVLLVISAVSSFLLVAEIPLFSFKFSGFDFAKNLYQLLLMLAAAILLFVFSYAAWPMIIALYVLLSLIKNHFTATQQS